MTTGRKFFSGNTLEIAVMQAARHHGLQPEEVAYRKIEKRHGFLRSRKGVVIEVDPEAPQTAPGEPAAPASEPETEEPIQEVLVEEVAEAAPPRLEIPPEEPEPVQEVEARPKPVAAPEEAPEQLREMLAEPEDDEMGEPVSIEELMDAARRGLQEIMGFAKLDVVADIREGDEQLEIELSGPDRDRLVEDRGNLLLAIQHLLPRLIRGYTGSSIPCQVDSEDFHATRAVELEKMAREAAQEVVDRQRSRTLPPMNPAERRIIHVTLADNKEIATESQGKGFFKRVTISPGPRRPRGFDRYNR